MTGGADTLVQRTMQFIQQQLAIVGVKVNVEPLEAGVLTAKEFNVKGPEDATIVMLYTGWSSSTGDADWGSRPMLYTKAFPPVLANLAWYSSPVTDAAIEEGLATVDPSKRAAAYAKEQARCGRTRLGSSSHVAQPGGVFEEPCMGCSCVLISILHLTADASLD